MLPDARGLYKRLSARESIDYFGRLQGLDEATIATRCEALCKALDMDDIMERRSEGFSQGQRVKTAIARALVHDPKNCILDEPTNGLDVMATRYARVPAAFEIRRPLRAVFQPHHAGGRCLV